jgi:hypothetical protein
MKKTIFVVAGLLAVIGAVLVAAEDTVMTFKIAGGGEGSLTESSTGYTYSRGELRFTSACSPKRFTFYVRELSQAGKQSLPARSLWGDNEFVYVVDKDGRTNMSLYLMDSPVERSIGMWFKRFGGQSPEFLASKEEMRLGGVGGISVVKEVHDFHFAGGGQKKRVALAYWKVGHTTGLLIAWNKASWDDEPVAMVDGVLASISTTTTAVSPGF